MAAKRYSWRNIVNRALNLALFLALCFMLGTGLLLWFRLPPGQRGGRGLEAMGMSRHEWGDLHFYVAITFFILILVHLIMNWTWLRKVAGSNRVWPIVLGIGLGLLIVLILLLLPVTAPAR